MTLISVPLKQEHGANAWSAWLKQKNSLQQNSDHTECSNEEINLNLIQFIRHLRKPNGEHYRPDTLLYLLYGESCHVELEM